eukprot:6044430-Karenia_brevis.AAC.1
MEDSNRDKLTQQAWEEVEAITALDLTNAYGLFYRSGAIEEVSSCLPMLQGMVRSQWQNCENKFWMRVEGRWQQYATRRGGYQGLRLITIMFCCSLRQSFRRGAHEAASVAKPKYQDDSYLAGTLLSLAE